MSGRNAIQSAISFKVSKVSGALATIFAVSSAAISLIVLPV